jgi:hypothetical protein
VDDLLILAADSERRNDFFHLGSDGSRALGAALQVDDEANSCTNDTMPEDECR